MMTVQVDRICKQILALDVPIRLPFLAVWFILFAAALSAMVLAMMQLC